MRAFRMVIASLAVVCLFARPIAAQGAASEMDAVQRIVEATTAAFNAEKLEELLALYADDAKIDSKAAGKQISKGEYRDVVSRLFSRRVVSRTDTGSLTVSLADPTHATVDGVVYIHLTSGGRSGGANRWKLEKRDGRWLIVETKYQ